MAERTQIASFPTPTPEPHKNPTMPKRAAKPRGADAKRPWGRPECLDMVAVKERTVPDGWDPYGHIAQPIHAIAAALEGHSNKDVWQHLVKPFVMAGDTKPIPMPPPLPRMRPIRDEEAPEMRCAVDLENTENTLPPSLLCRKHETFVWIAHFSQLCML
jgi:hypothetical protein